MTSETPGPQAPESGHLEPRTPHSAARAPDPHPEHPPTAVIGAGNMATAILRGATDAGVLDQSRLIVADPDETRRSPFRHAVPAAADAVERLRTLEDRHHRPGVILLATKPQALDSVADELATALGPGDPPRVLISILAGTTAARLEEAFGGCARIVRVMPNTPAQIRRGVTAIAPGPGITDADLAWPRRLFAAVGDVVDLDEPLMNAFTAVAGSGPAYVFYLAEAMAAAGEALGLPPDLAARCARGTIAGAAELMARDERTAAELRAAVTSKGGTTAAACETFDRLELTAVVRAAIAAARDRGDELAAGA